MATLAAFGLVACGGAGVGSDGRGAAPAEQPRAAGPEAPKPQGAGRASAIPDVAVLDVASGDEFALGSRQLGVTGTPTFAHFDGAGRPLDAWVGVFDEDRVLDGARRT